jgi:nicotinamidase-related amidase
MKTLIVIDTQNDFITGPLGTPETVAIVPKVKKKIEEYVSRGERIIFTRDTHFEDYLETNEGKYLPIEHCIHETNGWEVTDVLHTYIQTYDNADVIDKHSFGYKNWYRWFEELIDNDIEIVGVCTDICVVSNALSLKANFSENNITVDASCCAGTTPENHKAALQVMKSCQINVIGE